ncbi:transcriptional corepressor Tup11 [Schizosaccharomyces cryophilus OY26]|uniref:Transcriptional corepressor Tup11 n=1 Tax=Schizosaccharomyces cryophilus (strain OY26 / ATCC MYA-4695 / CBS 11777 / NBRC 106824 / NRRL Y48691) TaxID=653667 RepID=S9XG67_SCHCR|nr:transcriptional corepressor Tup11 [Schizosaccharomyces cryophilus OY26]EPY52656.1 transcriptional corepressor Tup11 [Schizosaccharomyces cryophilus OY26]
MVSMDKSKNVQEILDALKSEYDLLHKNAPNTESRANDYETSMIQSQIQDIEDFRKSLDEMIEKQKAIRETYEREANAIKHELDALGVDAFNSTKPSFNERINKDVKPSQPSTSSKPLNTVDATKIPSMQPFPSAQQPGFLSNPVHDSSSNAPVAAATGEHQNITHPGQQTVLGNNVTNISEPSVYVSPISYAGTSIPPHAAVPGNTQVASLPGYYVANPEQQQKQQQQQQSSQLQTQEIPNAANSISQYTSRQAYQEHEAHARDVGQPSAYTQKKSQSPSWYVTYNPACRRLFNINLIHTLEHPSVVCCTKFSHNGKYLATGCNRATNIFDVHTGQRLFTLNEDSPDQSRDLYVRTIAFSPDGNYLVTGTEDRQIKLWDLNTQKVRFLFSGHEQDIYSLDFSHNGRFIVSGSGDHTARLWDVETGQCILKLEIENGVTAIAISPNDQYIAVGSLDQIIRVWSVSGTLVERLEGHKESVYSIAFSPDSKILVSGSLDKTIKVWELQFAQSVGLSAIKPEGVCKATYYGHSDFVLSVAVSPDNRWALSGSKDRSIQFWDLQTGQSYLTCQGHKNSVISVSFSPDGKQFASGSGDLRARIWSVDPASP